MIEIHGGKIPKSNLTMYQILANRGNKFWGMEMLEVIGSIINGKIYFDQPCSFQEKKEAKELWMVLSITQKF